MNSDGKDKIMRMQDDYKRAFALGFRYLYIRHNDLKNQTSVAKAAKVQSAMISNILNGKEGRFPGFKSQQKISDVFRMDVFDVVEIGKKIQDGLDPARFVMDRETAPPKHSSLEVQEIINEFDLEKYEGGLDGLSIYEKTVIKMIRSLQDKEDLQELFDFVCTLLISNKLKKLKKISQLSN